MDKPVRLLAITNLYPTDTQVGTPAIKNQLAILEKMGVEVHLLSIERRDKWNYFRALWDVFQLNFQPQKYDLIHAYYGHCGFIARSQFKSPVIVTFLGSDILFSRDAVLGRLVAKFVDVVIVMSEQMKYYSGRKDAEVIPFGVNTDIFYPHPYLHAREALNLDQSVKYILFPYNPERKEKRFDLVEETAALLKKKGYPVEILVVHDETHENMALYMNAADGFILTSDYEGSPVAIREAVACGLPVISVDVGDVKKILAQYDNCYITRQNSAELAAAFEKVILSNRRISEIDLKRVSIEHSTEAVYQLYTRIINSTRF